jgi:hypothetical protein
MLSRSLGRAALAAAIGTVALASACNATTITAWTFENNSVAVNNNPAPSTGSGTASSIGMDGTPTPNPGVTTDDVLVGKGSDTGANGNANTSQTWRVRAQQSGSNGAANGWYSNAAIGTQGAVFASSTVGYNSINVGFDWYATTQGEANLQLRYTNDITAANPTWTNVPVTLGAQDTGLAAVTNSSSPNTVMGSYLRDNLLTNGSSAGQDWFPGLTATIADPAAANDPNFAFELVNASTGGDCFSTQGTGLNNSSGNWRFDNISVNGTLAPEPTSLGLAALAFVGVATRRRAAR